MDTKTYLEDEENRNITKDQQLHDYMKFRKENDRWLHPLVYQTNVVGADRMEIPFARIQYEQLADIPDQALDETIRDMGLFLVYPNEDKEFEILPVGRTAIDSLFARAGITGPSLYRTDTKGEKTAMEPVRKASIVTEFLKLNSENSSLLVRDGKVRYFGSKEYGILPADEGIAALENYLAAEHPDYQFSNGMISQEYMVARYLAHDSAAETDIQSKLKDAGFDADKVELGFQFSDSDVGNSEMRVRTYLVINDTSVMMGRPFGVRHERGNSVDDFKELLPKAGASYTEAEDQIEALGNTEIAHVAGTFLNLAKKVKVLPMGEAKKKAEELKLKITGSVTGIDIYIALNELISDIKTSKGLTATQFVRYTEAVADLLFVDFKAYDRPFVEKEN